MTFLQQKEICTLENEQLNMKRKQETVLAMNKMSEIEALNMYVFHLTPS